MAVATKFDWVKNEYMKHRQRRQSEAVYLTNHPPMGQVVLGGMWWLLLGLMILTVDPKVVRDIAFPGFYLPLPGLIALATGWTVGLYRRSVVKGLFWGIGIGLFVFLRVMGLGDGLNAMLIVGLLLVLEWYWHVSNGKISLNE